MQPSAMASNLRLRPGFTVALVADSIGLGFKCASKCSTSGRVRTLSLLKVHLPDGQQVSFQCLNLQHKVRAVSMNRTVDPRIGLHFSP